MNCACLNAAYLHLQRHCTFSMYARNADRHNCARACVYLGVALCFSAMLLSHWCMELVVMWFTSKEGVGRVGVLMSR